MNTGDANKRLAGPAAEVSPTSRPRSAGVPPSASPAKDVDKPRGYIKLSQAPEADFRDKVVLDIGSSTGGFTQYALEQGAAKVIAVEKGTRQMQAPLRFDPRVELHEKTDIFEFGTLEPIDIIVADVSFVSLTKVLMYARMELARSDTDFLAMLKPQFEAMEKQLNKGVVKNEKMRREIIKDFENWLKRNGFLIVKKHDNELFGKNGNRERFYWLRLAKVAAGK